jgi:hypothetical protein
MAMFEVLLAQNEDPFPFTWVLPDGQRSLGLLIRVQEVAHLETRVRQQGRARAHRSRWVSPALIVNEPLPEGAAAPLQRSQVNWFCSIQRADQDTISPWLALEFPDVLEDLFPMGHWEALPAILQAWLTGSEQTAAEVLGGLRTLREEHAQHWHATLPAFRQSRKREHRRRERCARELEALGCTKLAGRGPRRYTYGPLEIRVIHSFHAVAVSWPGGIMPPLHVKWKQLPALLNWLCPEGPMPLRPELPVALPPPAPPG